MSGAKQPIKYRWTAGLRLLSNQIPRASVRTTLTYRFTRRLSAGLEYNPRADEVGFIGNLLVLYETAKRPAFIIGTSTDRIGTPSGQSFYGTFSKNLRRETKLPIAPYVGISYGTFDDRFRPIGGLSVGITEQWSLLGTYNGEHAHFLVNYTRGRHAVSLVMVKGRDPGISYSIAF